MKVPERHLQPNCHGARPTVPFDTGIAAISGASQSGLRRNRHYHAGSRDVVFREGRSEPSRTTSGGAEYSQLSAPSP